MRCIEELRQIDDYEERFEYLAIRGRVGDVTFGFERSFNQEFYTSTQWRQVRQHVIARDMGCDLGVEGYDIHGRISIHHMNPMTPDDIKYDNADILDPRYLITTTHQTHNAIHYGDASLLVKPLVERRPGDTLLWSR